MAVIRLTTLGHTGLVAADGREVLSVLAQPKRFALLVYLAVEGSRGFLRRDTVAALFWPESDQSTARANLRKSLHYLRRSLGRGVIESRGDEEIGIDASRLRCDVVELLASGDAPAAGDFLVGFHISGTTSEWEDWIASVREQVRPFLSTAGHAAASEPSVPEADEEDRAPVESEEDLKGSRALATLAVVVAIVAVGWALTRAPQVPQTRYDVVRLGSGAQFPSVVQRHYDLPPDGSGILFRDSVGGVQSTWWKPLNQVSAVHVQGLDDAVTPVFSPDGEWILFARDGELRKLPVDGESSVVLLDSISDDFNPGLAWLPRDRVLFEDRQRGLRLLNETDGSIEHLATAEDVGEVFHVRAAPGGEGVFVTGCDGWCDESVPRLSYIDLERDTVLPLRPRVWMAWPMEDGRLVMVDDEGAVVAATFDARDGTLGPPVPLLDGVKAAPIPDITIGVDGSLLYVPGAVDPYGQRLVWVDREGRQTPVDPDWPRDFEIRSMALSPDGNRLALELSEDATSHGEIWIKDLPTGPLSPLTAGRVAKRRPVWNADGTALFFIVESTDSTAGGIGWLPADGRTAVPEMFLTPDDPIYEVAFTTDWAVAVGHLGGTDGRERLALTDLAAPERWRTIVESEAHEYGIALSPDGRWLAYVSEMGGRPEVYVRSFPGRGPRVQVSQDGGVEPRWSRSGEELFFRSLRPGDASHGWTAFLMLARVSGATDFHVESIEPLFGTPAYERGSTVPLYDVSPDGQRFLMVTSVAPWDWSQGEAVYSRSWYWSEEIQERLGG